MKHQKLLFIVFAVMLLAFGGWFAVLEDIDPFTYGYKGQIAFHAFGGIFLWGLLTLINYFWLKRRHHESNKTRLALDSLRQGFIVAVGIVGILIFRTIDVLNVLSASVYIIALILIEFFFRNRRASYGK